VSYLLTTAATKIATLPWLLGEEVAEQKDICTKTRVFWLDTARLPALLLRSALLCDLVVILKNIGVLSLTILHNSCISSVGAGYCSSAISLVPR
jgi:hypothetical protein